MKIDYRKTIDSLKEEGLIESGDKYAVCLFQTESESNGVTTTYITSKVDCIMTANADELKLIEIDKKTGEYLGNCLVFKKSDLVCGKKLKERKFIWASRGLFGGMYVTIHFIAEKFVHTYLIPKKHCGYEQKEAREELYTFVKETYNVYYREQELLYKNNK